MLPNYFDKEEDETNQRPKIYKSAIEIIGDNEVTLKARLMSMHETLIEIINSVKEVRAEVNHFKKKIIMQRKEEKDISAKERYLQQANIKEYY